MTINEYLVSPFLSAVEFILIYIYADKLGLINDRNADNT